MHFTTQRRLDDGVREREFTLGDIPGTLWIPPTASPAVPLILQGHPGGLSRMRPRLQARATHAAREGFASATIELPGGGSRSALPDIDRARSDLQEAIRAGQPITDDIVDRLVLPLVERAVPEWRAVLDALLDLPEIDGPVGYSGGVISIGVRLAIVEPRITAAGFFAGSFVPRSILAQAHRVTIPVLMLLQWDDEYNDRQMALDLFDAFGSQEKALHANMGGHTGVPQHEGENSDGFFMRHLRVAAGG